MKPVVPRVQALRDIDATLAHYLSEGAAGAARGFIDSLERGYAEISQNPAAGSPRYALELNLPGLRVWPLERYPYLVFYVERPDCIDVWRILHGRRDIPAWMQDPDTH